MNLNKTIIITGASKGIGFAIAKEFAFDNYDIAICSRDKNNLIEASKELLQINNSLNIFTYQCDMSKKEEVINFANESLNRFKNIDILVNNAGSFVPSSFVNDEIKDDSLEKMISINLYSAYWMGKSIIPKMLKQNYGMIVNISSIAGLKAYKGSSAYSVSKFALTGYTKQLRMELEESNIKVLGIYPGATFTDSWKQSDLPRDRFVDPSDIAKMILTSTKLSKSCNIEDIVIRPQLGDL